MLFVGAHAIWRQTVGSRAGGILPGVRIRQIDYNHSVGAFFAEVRTDELSLQDLIKAGLLVGLPLALILSSPTLAPPCINAYAGYGAFPLAGLQWKHAAVVVIVRSINAARRVAFPEAVSERKSNVVQAP